MNLTEKQLQKLMTTMNTCGLFVTCGTAPHNVMSTHWGTVGTLWNKQVFLLPVRRSKLSHEIIDKTQSFAVCVPEKDMRDEIILCDHLSGYTSDKFSALNLHARRARHIDSYVIADCGFILECKVIYAADMEEGKCFDSFPSEMYEHRDFHTLYFGEITDVYRN